MGWPAARRSERIRDPTGSESHVRIRRRLAEVTATTKDGTSWALGHPRSTTASARGVRLVSISRFQQTYDSSPYFISLCSMRSSWLSMAFVAVPSRPTELSFLIQPGIRS